MFSVSIIICTYNRAQHLRQTLEAMQRVCTPEGTQVELVVVDNASTDGTAELIKSFTLPHMQMRYVSEPKRGLSQARNAGLEAARGEIILFTDDDVRPPQDWIVGMCSQILAGKCDAVAGGVRLAPHLLRDWMTPFHMGWLASTERLSQNHGEELVGANTAFRRAILEKVPKFDTELGAGALGFGEETLFARQLKRAGFQIVPLLDVAVEHHFDVSRLAGSSFADTARKMGRSQAYVAHHWEHDRIAKPALKLVRSVLRLGYWRLKKNKWRVQSEGMPEWEMEMLYDISFYKQYLQERNRSAKYEKYGLVKLTNG